MAVACLGLWVQCPMFSVWLSSQTPMNASPQADELDDSLSSSMHPRWLKGPSHPPRLVHLPPPDPHPLLHYPKLVCWMTVRLTLFTHVGSLVHLTPLMRRATRRDCASGWGLFMSSVALTGGFEAPQSSV